MPSEAQLLASLVEYAKGRINAERQLLTDRINMILSIPTALTPSMQEQLHAHQRKLNKLDNDLATITGLTNRINAIRTNVTISAKDKDARVKTEFYKFLSNYSNVYEGKRHTYVVKKGKSQFAAIMESLEEYKNIQGKIDKVDKLVNQMAAKRLMKGNTVVGTNEQLHRDVGMKLLRQKQMTEIYKQKIVMLERQRIIDKRNKKASKLEAAKDQSLINQAQHQAQGHTIRAALSGMRHTITDFRLQRLKKKKFKQKSATMILLKQEAIGRLSKLKKYNEIGNIDERSWAEKRVEALENKTGKRL